MLALKNGRLLKEEFPDANITICYIDIRTNEKGFEEYYQRAKDFDIRLVRCKVGEISEDPETKNVNLRVYSSLTDEVINIDADLVVLSTAALPSKGTQQIVQVLNLDTNTYGFLTESHFGLLPQETKTKGIFIAGFAQGPKNISYSVSQARAAASKVAELTSHSTMVDRAQKLGFYTVNQYEVIYLVVPGYIEPQPMKLAPSYTTALPSASSLSPDYTQSLFEWLRERVFDPAAPLVEDTP